MNKYSKNKYEIKNHYGVELRKLTDYQFNKKLEAVKDKLKPETNYYNKQVLHNIDLFMEYDPDLLNFLLANFSPSLLVENLSEQCIVYADKDGFVATTLLLARIEGGIKDEDGFNFDVEDVYSEYCNVEEFTEFNNNPYGLEGVNDNNLASYLIEDFIERYDEYTYGYEYYETYNEEEDYYSLDYDGLIEACLYGTWLFFDENNAESVINALEYIRSMYLVIYNGKIFKADKDL